MTQTDIPTSQLTRQQAKEAACRLAIKRGFCLFRRNFHVFIMTSDGKSQPYTHSPDISMIWHVALEALRYEEANEQKIDVPPSVRFAANVVHNAFIHPVMPFTWGKVRDLVDLAHDVTGKIAYSEVQNDE